MVRRQSVADVLSPSATGFGLELLTGHSHTLTAVCFSRDQLWQRHACTQEAPGACARKLGGAKSEAAPRSASAALGAGDGRPPTCHGRGPYRHGRKQCLARAVVTRTRRSISYQLLKRPSNSPPSKTQERVRGTLPRRTKERVPPPVLRPPQARRPPPPPSLAEASPHRHTGTGAAALSLSVRIFGAAAMGTLFLSPL